jgi:predicted outer membrane repeat protein
LFIEDSSPTLRKLIVQQNTGSDMAGGMYCRGCSSLIQDVQFVDNEALTGSGGGLRIALDSAPVLERVTFERNVAEEGGGIYIHNSYGDAFSMTDVTFAHNRASSGGGIYSNGALPTLDRALFVGNEAESNGGGMCAYDGARATNSTFIGNAATRYGGGLFAWWGDFVITNTAFVANSAGGEDLYDGGAIHAGDSRVEISNVIAAGNVASSWAGGIYLFEMLGGGIDNVTIAGNQANRSAGLVISSPTAPFPVTNSTIIDNSAAITWGGIYLSGDDITLVNVSVTGNTSPEGGGIHLNTGTAPVVGGSNVYGNSPEQYSGFADPTGTDGNLSTDPQHVDTSSPSPAHWDLHLEAWSPLIDAGDPTILDPDGSPSDIGAYGGPDAEYWDLDWDGYYEWWQPGEYDFASYPVDAWDCDDRDEDVYPGNGC